MQLNMNRQPTVGKDPRCQPAGLALRTSYIDAEAFMVISFRFCARKCAMPSFHKSKEGSPFSTPVYFRKLLNNAFIFPPLQTNMEPNGGPKVPLKNGWVFWAPESVGAQRIFRWPQAICAQSGPRQGAVGDPSWGEGSGVRIWWLMGLSP